MLIYIGFCYNMLFYVNRYSSVITYCFMLIQIVFCYNIVFMLIQIVFCYNILFYVNPNSFLL